MDTGYLNKRFGDIEHKSYRYEPLQLTGYGIFRPKIDCIQESQMPPPPPPMGPQATLLLRKTATESDNIMIEHCFRLVGISSFRCSN